MTARKPKPVRAFALVTRGRIVRDRDAVPVYRTLAQARHGRIASHDLDEVPTPVIVSPVTADDPAAEVRRLRRALRKVRDTIGPTIPRCCAGGGCEIEAALSDIDAALRGRRGR